ncbi:hypothetical protein BpHYR1_047381 [Brachionus plicatilis]|uniref:Uncharacterized protein n=1 Tax=Brachionus plicatilis TaxID=10195 RepID=A0A3M7QUI9_BRAPC|nr:hypothetical protein BpHYR1_047381 [Brachionus plicatilis]
MINHGSATLTIFQFGAFLSELEASHTLNEFKLQYLFSSFKIWKDKKLSARKKKIFWKQNKETILTSDTILDVMKKRRRFDLKLQFALKNRHTTSGH